MVFGVGGVGLNVVQFAQLAGAYPIVAVDLVDSEACDGKGTSAPRTALIPPPPATWSARSEKSSAQQGPDKVIETTGVKSVIELAYNLTHADGTCVLVGVPNEKVTIYTLPIHFNKVLTGSHGGDAVPQVDIPRLIRLNRAGRLSFDGIITHEFPLDRDQCGARPRAQRRRRQSGAENRRPQARYGIPAFIMLASAFQARSSLVILGCCRERFIDIAGSGQ